MVAAFVLVVGFLTMAMQSRSLVPTRMQSVAELSYEFIANMLRENVGKEGIKYMPFVFTLFMFILACNMLGMLPYSFTVTSHIVVTFALAALVFVVVTLIGFARHGIGFLKLFVPDGVPVRSAHPHRADRTDFLHDPADQSVRSTVRQHDGRTHDAESVRRFRR